MAKSKKRRKPRHQKQFDKFTKDDKNHGRLQIYLLVGMAIMGSILLLYMSS